MRDLGAAVGGVGQVGTKRRNERERAGDEQDAELVSGQHDGGDPFNEIVS